MCSRKYFIYSITKFISTGLLSTDFSFSDLEKTILRLVDIKEYKGDKKNLKLAVHSMNEILLMDNFTISFKGTRPILREADPIDLNEETISENEKEFLRKQFDENILIQELGFDDNITRYLQNRVNEIQECPKDKVPLGSIFLLGSTLEGLLFAVASNSRSVFIASSLAPKDKSGNIKKLNEWKLSELIDVAYDTKFIELDVKKFSHVLRDFRNYIHPYKQMSQNFNPNQSTVDICWQVFKAVFNQLKVRKI